MVKLLRIVVVEVRGIEPAGFEGPNVTNVRHYGGIGRQVFYLFVKIVCLFGSMAKDGKRKVQQNGRISMPKEFREDNDIEKGDYVFWKRHSRDKSKLIIEVRKEDEEA